MDMYKFFGSTELSTHTIYIGRKLPESAEGWMFQMRAPRCHNSLLSRRWDFAISTSM